MITLENNFIKAEIATKGAELQALFSKDTNISYLWNGDKNYWGKHSPVLFPIVGALKNDEYLYQDKTYKMSRHGFARDYDFKVEQISAYEAVFTLTENDETLKSYPFCFELQLRYKLIEHKLNVTYKVKNTGEQELLFSLGAHPAFAVPNTADTNYSDYFLAFNEDEKLIHWKLENGLITNERETLNLSRHKLKLKHDLFYNDALVFKTMQSNCISLLNTKNDFGLHFHFEDFPYFGIWAAKDASFLCLEPWCGIADSINHNQQLNVKEGINKLAPSCNWERYWEVECF